MNKGFFVVFLGVVLGAMALIFVNQSTTPTAAAPDTRQSAQTSSGQGSPAPVAPVSAQPATGQPVTGQPDVATSPEPPKTEPARPEPAKPEPAKPEPVKPAPVKPEPAKPEPAKPEPAKPEPAKPVTPATPEPAKPATPPATPEPAKPTPMTPVTATPETPAKPGAVSKSLTLVNIGLHFKGSGMVLRIEANAPFSYKTFALASPDRYVVDLVGTWGNMRAPTVPSNNMIKGARVGKQAGGPRLVLDMQRAPKKHNVTWISQSVLEILLE